MKRASAKNSITPSLSCVAFLSIGLVCLLTDVNCWAPAKSLTYHGRVVPRNRLVSALKSLQGETQDRPWLEDPLSIPVSTRKQKSTTKTDMFIEEFQLTLQLFLGCMGVSFLLISWEDISMYHPMRLRSQVVISTSSSPQSKPFAIPRDFSSQWGRSTVLGLAAGGAERQAIAAAGDLESSTYKDLPSYNEVMLTHRTDRIPLWDARGKDAVVPTTRKDVTDSARAIQLALLRIRDCVKLAENYEWDQLTAALNEKVLRSDLQSACYILKGADEFLSRDARDEIGFDWGSCSWRHCGALSDAQEAIDALEHQVGMLEPFECIYCLDVVERSLRDMLAVTDKYADRSLKIPDYIPIQRMSDLSNEEGSDLDRQDEEYMTTLSFFRNIFE